MNTHAPHPLPVARDRCGGHLRSWLSPANVLTLLFCVAGGLLISHHDLWRDEAQAFLIARDSHSISDLLGYVHYEGHPPLWYVLLFLLTRVTLLPQAMQWLHLAMAAATVYLVIRCAPFLWPAKLLFPFGYYTLFEYGILFVAALAAFWIACAHQYDSGQQWCTGQSDRGSDGSGRRCRER